MKSGQSRLIGPGSNDYGKNEPTETKKVQIPTCGRMVHYFPILPDALKVDNPDYCGMLPAIVVEASDLAINIVVFSMEGNPCQSKYSVMHKSEVLDFSTGEPTRSYWDWPTIK